MSDQKIPIISWGGIPADKADTLFALAKECGFTTHLGLYGKQENAIASLDAAERAGIGIIVNFPELRSSTDEAVASIKDHPALVAYHLKDEPEVEDYPWLKSLCETVGQIDSIHPCYINLLPNWYWGVEEYAENIERFASEFDLQFYSFDNYPIVEENGVAVVRPDWYRNLEEFSAMARSFGKPFWAFALTTPHSITDPLPAVYPLPTIGHIRLQVFSNLLYGAQAIQYFNFLGLIDPATCQKKDTYEIVDIVNSEIKAYSSVFAGSVVKGVWHTGEVIPTGTRRLESYPHKKIQSLKVNGDGAVVSLIEKAGESYLAVQNRSCINQAILEVAFSGKVRLLTPQQELRYDETPLELDPGELIIFKL